MNKKSYQYLMMISVIMLMVANGYMLSGCSEEKNSVKIGYKGNTEQLVLANLFAEVIKKETKYKTILVEHKSSILAFEALKGGKIDLYPEYTGTIDNIHLKDEKEGQEKFELEEMLDLLKEKHEIIGLKPLNVDNAFRFATTKEKAKEAEVKALSDLKKVSGEWKLGATSEFIEREDGYKKFIEEYGFSFKGSKGAESEVRYIALENKEVDIVQVYLTDAYVVMMNLMILDDDKGVFKEVSPMPLFHKDFAESKKEVVKAIKKLENKISTGDLLELNILVDEDKESPTDVAERYLKEEGIVH